MQSLITVCLLLASPLLVFAAKERYEPPVIGIDLGTTYSVVGIWQNDNVEIIPNEMGNRITPSVVAFTPTERMIGDSARNQIERNHENTVYAVKRLMGRQFKEDIVQKDKEILSYAIIGDDHGRAAVSVQFKGESKTFKPEEISAMILAKMKEIAESYLNQKVVNAVVTVPAYFNDAQRQATKDAGVIAGLNVVRILNEPTAAAIAYGLDKGDGEKRVLVFDLGGGTFDVSLLTIDQGFFEVLATNGDTHLGGEDFDNRIIQHFVKVIKKKHNVDVSRNQYTLARLRKASESAKRKLSSLPEAQVEIDNLVEGVDFSEKLTRAKFEELCADLFKGTLEPVKAVLADANMDKEKIDEVVLVGGSTRIPKIQALIKEFFNGKQPNKGINPDEAIAYGAAVQAGVLSGATELSGKVLLIDVIPLSLGIETIGGVFLPIITRNSIIPASKKQTVTTTTDNQANILFQVFEGERAMTKDNRNLGQFDLSGIKKAPRGVPQVEVQMDVDVDGILHVKATDLSSGSTESISITNDKMRLSQEEIDRMVEDAKTYEEEDKKSREQSSARVALEQYAYQAKGQAATGGEYERYLTEEEREKITTAVTNTINWLDERETKDGATKEQYDEKLTALKASIDELLEKAKKEKKDTEGDAKPSDSEAKDDSDKDEVKDTSSSADESDDDHEEF